MDDRKNTDETPVMGKEEVSRIEELLNQERYTPVEAAEVLNLPQRRIFSAVYGGDLKATMAGNDIVEISRTDLVDWLRRQQ